MQMRGRVNERLYILTRMVSGGVGDTTDTVWKCEESEEMESCAVFRDCAPQTVVLGRLIENQIQATIFPISHCLT